MVQRPQAVAQTPNYITMTLWSKRYDPCCDSYAAVPGCIGRVEVTDPSDGKAHTVGFVDSIVHSPVIDELIRDHRIHMRYQRMVGPRPSTRPIVRCEYMLMPDVERKTGLQGTFFLDLWEPDVPLLSRLDQARLR